MTNTSPIVKGMRSRLKINRLVPIHLNPTSIQIQNADGESAQNLKQSPTRPLPAPFLVWR